MTRTHSAKQVAAIALSLKRFGFVSPLLIDENNVIIKGNGCVAAAKTLGLVEAPCLRVSGLSPAEIRAYAIADNKLAEKAGWDRGLLAIELQELAEFDLDITLTGFDLPEIDGLITDAEEAAPEGNEQDNAIPEKQAIAVSRPGDLWQLGRHAVLCADAREASSYRALMGDDRAAMVFTDPPYNVRIRGNVSGRGRHKHREFAVASGELSEEAFEKFLTDALQLAAAACRDGAIAFICMDWRHVSEVLKAGHVSFAELKNWCVWVKTNAGMGTFYRSQHEFVLAWRVGTASPINNFGLGGSGRYRTNVWRYPGVNAFKTGREDELEAHPTVKPVELVADAIRDVSHRGDIVLDPFGGSGTTLIAAEKTGRIGRLIEIDPIYCDVAVRRFEKVTGKSATLRNGGETFERVSLARRGTRPQEETKDEQRKRPRQ
jgi:DNA modification methylase